MTVRQVLALCAVLGSSMLFAAPAALGATCGEPDTSAKPASDKPVRATLTLDDKSSRVTLPFKRDDGRQSMTLFFNAAGCDLPPAPTKPRLLVITKSGSGDLTDAVSVKSVDVDQSEYVLTLDVDASKFKPGAYDALASARSSYLAPNRTPISVSRSESRLWIPIILGVVGGLVGFGLFLVLHAKSELDVGRRILVIVGLICLGAGAFAAAVSYWDQDVWKFDDNWRATLTAGFTGATTGGMVGLLGILFNPGPK
jgi:hypothetical protein